MLTIEDVARHAGGLLCLSGCRQGAVAQAVLAGDEARAVRAAGKLAEIFGRDRLLDRAAAPLAARRRPADRRAAGRGRNGRRWLSSPPTTSTTPTPDGHRLHDVLTATRHNVPLAELGARQRPNSEFYLKSAAEMAALFAERPEALAATQAIAERCDVSLDFSRRRLPGLPAPFRGLSRTASRPARPPSATCTPCATRACAPNTARSRPPAVKQLAHELAVIEAPAWPTTS